jgi:hypothetical protein
MEVSGQLQGPAALSPGNEPPVRIGQKTVQAPEPVRTLWSADGYL